VITGGASGIGARVGPGGPRPQLARGVVRCRASGKRCQVHFGPIGRFTCRRMSENPDAMAGFASEAARFFSDRNGGAVPRLGVVRARGSAGGRDPDKSS